MLERILKTPPSQGKVPGNEVDSKAALDDSLSTIDTTSLDQNKLYHDCTMARSY